MKTKTQRLYFLNRLVCSPLEAMFTLLIFILGKEAGGSPFQLAVLAASKPLVSIIAFYVSSMIISKPQRVKTYLILLNLTGLLPCFCFPWINTPWFFVGSFALFTTTSRASFPAWAEILKQNLGLDAMSFSISKGTSINYALLLSLPVLFSFWMDQNPGIWKMIYLMLATLQIANIFIVLLLPLTGKLPFEIGSRQHFRFNLITPLKEAWRVLKETPPFAKYLLMFFLGGAGIVATQSILPIYFKEVLQISYTQLALAFSFCKGIAFVMSSSIWARYANRISLYLLNGFMNFFTCLFFLCLFFAGIGVEWLYLGYLFYGIMQAGCELSWNMSGPLFSQNKESTLYSSLNLILVGIRGCICPFLGQWLFLQSGAFAVFTLAFLLCLTGFIYALWLNHAYKSQLPERSAS